MIKIIKGIYGRTVDGIVEAMTPRSAPFSLSETRETELIAMGVAEKIEAPVKASNYSNMKITELRKEASVLGVDTSATKSKKEMIAMIEAARKRENDNGI